MSTISKKNFFKQHLDIFIVIVVILVAGILGVSGSIDKIEYRVYDGLLGIKPPTEQNPDIMLVKIDDPALEEIGTWPWSRDILANVLVRMRELGAKADCFDIEYLSKSQLGVDPQTLEYLPDTFSDSLDTVSEIVTDLSDSIADGSIPAEYAPEITTQILNEYVAPTYQDLFDSVAGNLVRDNDEYFAKAIRYFGNAWLTINTADLSIKVSE